jgi:adenine-specific DNA-methyltransferase
MIMKFTNLRKLCDEVFGEENFIVQFIWQKGAGTQNDNNYVAISHEYVFMLC